MIKAFAITEQGAEKIVSLELNEMIKAKSKAFDCAVTFECKDYKDLVKFCYKTQSCSRGLLLFDNFKFKDYDDLTKKLNSSLQIITLKDFIVKDSMIKVECERLGEHDFASMQIEQDLGEEIIKLAKKNLGFEPKVSMHSPNTVFYVFVKDDHLYFGIDFIGKDLSKRSYRIFTAPGVVNSITYYAFMKLIDYSPKKKTVDLFSRAGVLIIETALSVSGVSINKYDKNLAFRKIPFLKKEDWESFLKKLDSEDKLEKVELTGYDPMLRNVEAGKKNAKLAGVDKLINFSKVDTDWLDTKLDARTVDLVMSRIPCPSKNKPDSEIKKIYKELYYQTEFFMKKKGRMAFMGENLSLLKEMMPVKDFKLISEDELYSGKQRLEVVVIEKN